MKKLNLDENLVLELYNSGLTCEEVGKKLGCSKIPIRRIINAHGITKQSIKEKNQEKYDLLRQERLEKKKADEERIVPQKVIDFYKMHTLKETAAYFRIGQARVRKVCLENGYEKPVFTWSSWSDETKEKAKKARAKSIVSTYGVANALCLGAPKIAEKKSKTNLKWKEDLESYGLSVEMEFPIEGKQYDLHIKNSNILIEINPTITHNVTISYADFAHLDRKMPVIAKKYHFDKWLTAREHGYELISVFDWQDHEKVLQLILAKVGRCSVKLGARQTLLKEIKKHEANVFLSKNHVLGPCKGNNVNIGLFYKDELVSVMTFGKPRKSVDYDFELLRFANKAECSVAGAASKLFKYFTSKNSNSKILTFSDNNLGNGKVYEKLGFQLETYIEGSSLWVNMKTKDTIRTTSIVWQGADRLLRNKIQNYFPVGLSREDFIFRGGRDIYKKEFEEHADDPLWWPGNLDILKHYGYVEVIDCGATKWSYQN